MDNSSHDGGDQAFLLLHLSALYQCPQGIRVRWWLRGWGMLWAIGAAMNAVALLYSSVRFCVRTIILAAVLVMRGGWSSLSVHMLIKQVEL